MSWQGILQTPEDVNTIHNVPARYTAGQPIGIIAVNLNYPKLPGNVANASTFDYPVLYKKVNFEIERLFEGDAAIEEEILNAAKELEAEGVRAIIGACGYFAHFQKKVADAVSIPVYLSSLCQLPIIRLGLKASQKIIVLAASAENLNDALLAELGESTRNLIIENIGGLESFAPIRWGKTELDNARLTKDLATFAADTVKAHPEAGAILLECSDLPPYAAAIQKATGLPVFDFITMIDWVERAILQKRYFGYF
jgi:aspartate/glutamate racemase